MKKERYSKSLDKISPLEKKKADLDRSAFFLSINYD